MIFQKQSMKRATGNKITAASMAFNHKLPDKRLNELRLF